MDITSIGSFSISGISAPHCPGMDELLKPRPTAPPPPTDVRLPLNFYPLHYNVELKPDMYGSDPEKFTFDGKVEIFLNCTKASSAIVLHINELDINQSSISFRLSRSNSGNTGPKWTNTEHDVRRQFFKIFLDNDCRVGLEYVLQLYFNGNLSDSLAGLYRSSYKEGNLTK